LACIPWIVTVAWLVVELTSAVVDGVTISGEVMGVVDVVAPIDC